MTKVLIIEDDESIRSLYQRAFSLEGFEVDAAAGGSVGLEKAQAARPDIILLDMMMPVMNGLETLRKLKDIPGLSDVPVIILSNYSDQDITNRAVALGAAFYVIKSDVDPAEVVEVARNTISKTGASEGKPS
jgi:CheY-like chemotaxis protein